MGIHGGYWSSAGQAPAGAAAWPTLGPSMSFTTYTYTSLFNFVKKHNNKCRMYIYDIYSQIEILIKTDKMKIQILNSTQIDFRHLQNI